MSNGSPVSAEHERILRGSVSRVFNESLGSDYATIGPDTVADLNATIARILISQLVAERRKMNHRFFLHSRLPPEVWTTTWQNLCLKDLVATTHVCHAWRSLALSSPDLWTHLRFSYYYKKNDFDSDEDSSIPRKFKPSYPAAAAASTLLERSRDKPLSIKVKFDTHELEKTVRLLGGALYDSAHRIQSIDASFDQQIYLPDFLERMGGCFPELRRLNCKGSWSYQYDMEDTLICFTDDSNFWAPRLGHLWTTPGLWSGWPSEVDAGMQLLHTLSLTPGTSSDISRALGCCPNVKALTLCFGNYVLVSESELNSANLTAVKAPHLEELIVLNLSPTWSERVDFDSHWQFLELATRRLIEVHLDIGYIRVNQDIVPATLSLPRMLLTLRDIRSSPQAYLEVDFAGESFGTIGVSVAEASHRTSLPRRRAIHCRPEMISPRELFNDESGLWVNIKPNHVTKLAVSLRFLNWMLESGTESFAIFGVAILSSVTHITVTDPQSYSLTDGDKELATLKQVDWRTITPNVESVVLAGCFWKVTTKQFTSLDDFLTELEAAQPPVPRILSSFE